MTFMCKKNRLAFLAAALAVGAGLSAYPVLADEFWENYQSVSGVFSSKIPQGHTETFSQIFVKESQLATSEEVSAVMDQRPYKNVLKSYVIKLDQTIGPALGKDEIADLVKREFQLYEDFYLSQGGKIVQKDDSGMHGVAGGEIHLAYPDKVFGDQHVKMRIMFTPSSRYEQIVTGPEAAVASVRTRDFFDSRLYDGISVVEEKVIDEWQQTTSPLSIFSVMSPAVIKPFFPNPPVVQSSDRSEIISMVFQDPVRNQGIYFTTYSYVFQTTLTMPLVKKFILNNFAQKNGASLKSVKFKNYDDDRQRHVLETSYVIPPPPNFLTTDTVRIRAIYDDSFLMVQQIMSSRKLANSEFSRMILGLAKFHPELYRPGGTPQQAGSAAQSDPSQSELAEKLKGAFGEDAAAPAPEATPPPTEGGSAPPATP